MLYTFSSANFSETQLAAFFSQMNAQDAVVLWSDGVYLPLKFPEYFSQLTTTCFALLADLEARGLETKSPIKVIDWTELVSVTENYFPQVAL